MKKRIPAVIICTLAVMLLLTSCTNIPFMRSVEALMTPPLYYSEYEGLVSSINSTLGSDIVLCNPTYGDYLSAISTGDMDGDGEEEAVVFYREAVDSKTVNFAVYDCVDDSWNQTCRYSGYGSEVYSLTMDDFDGDSHTELLIEWYYPGISNSSVISVYNYSSVNLNYREIEVKSCDIAEAVDADADGKPEIFYVSSETEDGHTVRTAELLKLDGGVLSDIGSAQVDPNIVEYVSVKTEKYSENMPMKIYLDASKNNNMMITEIVYWDSETKTLVAPLYDAEAGANTATLRYEQIQSADVNNDGLIEVPVQSPFKDESETVWDETLGEEGTEPEAKTPEYVTNWVYFDGTEPVSHIRSYVNSEDGYMINLGTFNNREITVSETEINGRQGWSVSYDGSADSLMTVAEVSEIRYDSGEYDSWITLIKNTDSIVCIRIDDAGVAAGIDEATAEKIITKLP